MVSVTIQLGSFLFLLQARVNSIGCTGDAAYYLFDFDMQMSVSKNKIIIYYSCHMQRLMPEIS